METAAPGVGGEVARIRSSVVLGDVVVGAVEEAVRGRQPVSLERAADLSLDEAGPVAAGVGLLAD
jgi:hypothetical protein